MIPSAPMRRLLVHRFDPDMLRLSIINRDLFSIPDWIVEPSRNDQAFGAMTLEGFFFSGLLQAGTTTIEIIASPDGTERAELSRSTDVHREYVDYVWWPEYDEAADFLVAEFKEMERRWSLEAEVDDHEKVRASMEFWGFRKLMTSLSLAIERQAHPGHWGRWPDLNRLGRYLPKEAVALFNDFTACFEVMKIAAPAVRWRDDGPRWDVLEDIRRSTSFAEHVRQHARLDETQHALKEVKRKILQTSLALVREHSEDLEMRDALVVTAPVGSSESHKVMSRLPGRIAEYFSDLMSAHADKDRRVVIYVFPDLDAQAVDLSFEVVKRTRHGAGTCSGTRSVLFVP